MMGGSVRGLAQQELTLLVQFLLVHVVYRHLPFFRGGTSRLRKSWGSLLRTFLSTTIPTTILGAASITALLALDWYYKLNSSDDEKTTLREKLNEVTNFKFLRKFAIMRIALDLGFYAAHRWMHWPSVYPVVHKKHHEYYTTNLWANHHFTILDLLLKGALGNNKY